MGKDARKKPKRADEGTLDWERNVDMPVQLAITRINRVTVATQESVMCVLDAVNMLNREGLSNSKISARAIALMDEIRAVGDHARDFARYMAVSILGPQAEDQFRDPGEAKS